MTAQPERAEREGDSQPLPVRSEASTAVIPETIRDINQHAEVAGFNPRLVLFIQETLTSRLALGIKRYGRPLETWNGRDAALDAFEEQCDATNYLKQLCMEHPIDTRYRLMYWNSLSLLFQLAETVSPTP